MTPEAIMLIKILSDVAMTAMQTISRVNEMTEAEVKAAIKEAEQLSTKLTDAVRSH